MISVKYSKTRLAQPEHLERRFDFDPAFVLVLLRDVRL